MAEAGTARTARTGGIPAGAGVVVTGAGHGIGRAIAARLAGEGARVVVNDLDGEAASRVAEAIGGFAVPGDATSEDGAEALVAAARAQLGEVDVWFGNAGIDVGGGLDTSPEDWARALEVNVLGHVRAARELVPGWLERRSGRFVVTASAAGLLTMLGSAPYSVTKHAAVAFAEWLAITYGDAGVRVSALCPQGVRTRLLDVADEFRTLLEPVALEPAEVAEQVVEGVAAERFLILPHPEVERYFQNKASDYDRWLAGMRKLQRSVFGA